MADTVTKPPNRRERILATRATLADRFPKAIMPKGKAKRPLAIGIHRAIRAACPDLISRAIHLALWDYTRGALYLRAMLEGAPRVDLDGNAVDTVTRKAADHAAAQLAALNASKAKAGKKRAAAVAQPMQVAA